MDTRIRWGAENRWTFSAAAEDRTDEWMISTGIPEGQLEEHNVQPLEFRNSLYLNLHPLPLKMSLTDNYRGQDFNINDLGWTDFSNTVEHYVWIGNNWQPGKKLVQQWGLDLNGWQRNMPNGTFPEGGGNVGTWLQTKGNFEYGGGWQWGQSDRRRYTGSATDGESRDNFFEDYGRFNLQPHYYTAGWAWFETDDRRWLSYSHEWSFGLFREGHKWTFNQAVSLKPRANLETSLALDWTHVWGVYEEDFNYGQPTTFRVGRWVTRYSPTLNLSFRATLQYDKDALPDVNNNYSKDGLLTNVLLAYNWSPGSWFYLVYDESNRLAEPLAYRREGDRTVRLKATYFFTVK